LYIQTVGSDLIVKIQITEHNKEYDISAREIFYLLDVYTVSQN